MDREPEVVVHAPQQHMLIDIFILPFIVLVIWYEIKIRLNISTPHIKRSLIFFIRWIVLVFLAK
jgi:hypothetical protein